MQNVFAVFAAYGPWNWFFLVVALFLLDAVVPGVHFLWFRLAAVLTGILAFATGMEWQWQLIAFVGSSVVAAFYVQKHVQPGVVASDMPDLNRRSRQYVGRSLILEEAIECGRGKVRVGDTVWSAEGSDAPAGAIVTVTGARGTVLMVKRAVTSGD